MNVAGVSAGRSGGARRSAGASRRTTQVRRNAVVVAWLVTAAALTGLTVIGPLARLGTWLPLHALLLGGIGSAITTWSAHFADTLLHRPALGGAALLDARLCAHTVGTVVVLTGVTIGRAEVTVVGVAVIMAQALTGVVAIGVQYRRAVAARMAPLAMHYAVALVLLALGAALGYLTSWADTTGRADLADVFYLAHTITMVLGFVGTTVLGTLTVLWPTMLRTRMEPEAARWAHRGLPFLVVGTVLMAGCGAWRPLALSGVLVYVAGACGVVVPAFKTALRVPPTSFATASAAAAISWLLGCIGFIGLGTYLADDLAAARETIHVVRLALGAGFALQVLVAALSYLTPVMLGGGPAMARRTNAVMNRFASYRVTAANTGLLLAVVALLPWEVRLAGGVLAGAVTAYLLAGMGRCLWLVAGRGSRRN
ncbi:hypothetical protein [Actinomyces lilanjuaniae]|uniref:hypothetical protein n=1 Tax=Actinomyces lilanjuaniae TaxID=2321394 RepID=UPI001FAABB68|nr:hypothetical protein [Actinomyces lilanjuaniae]